MDGDGIISEEELEEAVSGMVHVKEVGQRLTALLQANEKGGSVTYDKFKVCVRCLVLPAGNGLQR